MDFYRIVLKILGEGRSLVKKVSTEIGRPANPILVVRKQLKVAIINNRDKNVGATIPGYAHIFG